VNELRNTILPSPPIASKVSSQATPYPVVLITDWKIRKEGVYPLLFGEQFYHALNLMLKVTSIPEGSLRCHCSQKITTYSCIFLYQLQCFKLFGLLYREAR